VITYRPLDADALARILDAHIHELQRHVHTRLGERSFEIEVTEPARQLLLQRGASPEYGARELKRTIHRMLTQPLAALVAGGRVEPGRRVVVARAEGADSLRLDVAERPAAPAARSAQPVVLILDDNTQLLELLRHGLTGRGISIVTATTVEEARQAAARGPVDLALVDVMLPDGDGLTVAFEFLRRWPNVRIVMMSGTELSPDEMAVCERQDIPVLRKPFLIRDVVSLVTSGVGKAAAAGS
jgi:CheY-like chemotaxis protein